MSRPLNASLATIEVGGRSYPVVTAVACKVCGSTFRERAEGHMLNGTTFAKIAEVLPPEAGLTGRNLRDHYRNGHVPFVESSVQVYREQAAVARGEVLSPTVDRLRDSVELASAIVEQVKAGMVAGRVVPTVRDGLAAAAHLGRYAALIPDIAEGDYITVTMATLDAARETLDAAALRELDERLGANPVVAAFEARYAQRMQMAMGWTG